MKQLLKSFYSLLPFKQELFTLVKKVWHPPQSVYQHLHFKGIIKIPVDGQHSFKVKHYGYEVENDLYWSGIGNGWEKYSLDLWMKLCKRSSVILDIGANTGVYSLIAKSIKPQARVFAFEPVHKIFEKLQVNASLNKFDIVCTEAALSNYNGTAKIFVADTEHTYTVTVNKNILSDDIKTIETQINTLTLASFIEKNNLGAIDLIKLDVETHEPEVLEGFGDYLYKFKPTILIEVLSDEIGSKIQAFAEKCGYNYFNIDERKGIRKVDVITKSDYFNYLLCTPDTARAINLF